MEYGPKGIKTAEDVLEVLRDGASAYELHYVYGERIAGLLADALDQLHSQKRFTEDQIRRAWSRARQETKKHETDYDIADLVGALERPEE